MKKIFILLCLIGLVSCDGDSPYSGYAAYFSVDATHHPFNQIYGVGQYIRIKRKTRSTYEVTDVLGNKYEKQLSEYEVRQGFQYGYGGFIVGTNYEGTLMAYDWACPNCDMSIHRLELNDIGQATCSNCNTTYDLNIGGIPIEGTSRERLWQYRIFQAGNIITIQN